MFPRRLQGYFSARKLCRLWVLECFDGAIARGEPFVKWVDRLDPTLQHDGTHTFAHYMTIKYVSLHDPEMSCLFDRDGAIRSSHVALRKLQAYIWAHRFVLARRCQDMLKGKFATASHSLQAWQPLSSWLYSDPTITERRVSRLTRFDKSDQDLFTVVAECLWRVAQGDNRPWGVGALLPSGYVLIRKTSKVCTMRMRTYALGFSLCVCVCVCVCVCFFFFFFFHFHFVKTHLNIPHHFSRLMSTYYIYI